MRILFWASLAAVLYTYLLYPALIFLLARLRPRPFYAAPTTPSVSAVLAVHNGIELLRRKIEHLLSLDYPNLREILIVSDGSTDGTAEYLASLSQPLIRPIVLPEHGGKGSALNAAIARAAGDIILFVDIRPELDSGTLTRMAQCFADPSVGCVAAELKLVDAGHDAVAAAVGGLYWRYEQSIRLWEAAFDSPVGVYGGCYAIRRELARPLPAGIILDDMFQPLSVIRQGYRSVLSADAYVFDQWPATARKEFQRKVRTMAGNFQLLRLAPWVLTPQNRLWLQLVSHKLLRLVIPYLLAALFASSIVLGRHSIFYLSFAVLEAAAFLTGLLGLKLQLPLIGRLAAACSAFLVLNAAAVAGLFQFLARGDALWKMWKPTAAPVQDRLGKTQAIG